MKNNFETIEGKLQNRIYYKAKKVMVDGKTTRTHFEVEVKPVSNTTDAVIGFKFTAFSTPLELDSIGIHLRRDVEQACKAVGWKVY